MKKIIEKNRLSTIERTRDFIHIRTNGEFNGKSFYLSSTYEWRIGKDNMGLTILVPLLKERGRI